MLFSSDNFRQLVDFDVLIEEGVISLWDLQLSPTRPKRRDR